ncbi:MAG: MarR family winged helix-turn-helix transcriptional regulator [Pararhodobacter sp.]
MPSASEDQAPGATDSLTFRLIVLVNELTRPFNAGEGARHGITLSEWRCILWIAAHPEASGGDTADGTAMDRMTVSRSLRRLESTGLAARTIDPADRKRSCWRLTEKGMGVYAALTPRAFARDALIAQGIDARTLATVTEFVDTAIARLREDNRG